MNVVLIKECTTSTRHDTKLRANILNKLSCYHGKERIFSFSPKDQIFEAMENIFYGADNCVPCDVPSEESDKFWRLVLHSGISAIQLHHGGRSPG
jgi:hypothetical protein